MLNELSSFIKRSSAALKLALAPLRRRLKPFTTVYSENSVSQRWVLDAVEGVGKRGGIFVTKFNPDWIL